MYTALEKNRAYLIGIGEDAIVMVYLGRDFPDDHPPVFEFMDAETRELISFSLDQLTALEEQGALRYGGMTHLPQE